MKKSIIASVILSLVFISCKDNYTLCGVSRRVTLNAGFYELVGTQAVRKSAPSFSLQLLNGPVLIGNNVHLPAFSTELSSASDTARYVVQFDTGLPVDTLTAVYSTQNTVSSPGCDNVDIHTLRTISSTYHTVDSIKLTDNLVDQRGAENLQIFY
jgi:hypothetical protein